MEEDFFEEVPQNQQQFSIYTEKQKSKKYKRSYKSIVFAIMVIIILAITIYLPWWKYNADLDYPRDYPAADVNIRMETWYLDKTEIKSSEVFTEPKDYFDDTISVYKNTFILLIIVIIIAIITILFLALNFEVLKKITIIISIFSFIITLILPIYFAVALPPAFDKDMKDRNSGGWDKGFVGTRETKIPLEFDEKNKVIKEGTIKEKCSPTFGWYLTLLAFFFSLMSFIFLFMPEKLARKTDDWHLIRKGGEVDHTKIQSSSTMLGEIAPKKIFSKEEQAKVYYEKVQRFPKQQYQQPYYRKEDSPLKRKIPDSGIKSARDIFRKEEVVFQEQREPQFYLQEEKKKKKEEELEDFEEVE